MRQTLDSSGLSFSCESKHGNVISGHYWRQQEENEKPPVIISHGLAGSEQQPQVQAAAAVFRRFGFGVTTYSAGDIYQDRRSKVLDVTLTRYADDLENVIEWLREREVFDKPLLCGFSLGSSASLLYQLRRPRSILAAICFAPVVSGRDWLASLEYNRPGSYEIYCRSGDLVKYNGTTNVSKIISGNFVKDLLAYDFVEAADRIVTPNYFFVGAKDKTCPVSSVSRLARALSGRSTLCIIESMHHTARRPQELEAIKEVLGHLLSRNSPNFDVNRMSN
jgi:pimeloyl-ACP methyl ester carboxylesterase